jgi:TRAP-type C4-dicarboxylate transport system substrate-binding protein
MWKSYRGIVWVGVMIAFILVLPGGEGLGRAEAVHLKAVCFLPSSHPLAAVIPMYIEKVKEQTKGEVAIEFLGGPEIMAGPEQVKALQRGKMIQMVITVVSQYEALVPEAATTNLSKLLPWEERQRGYYNLLVESHKKADLMYLGRWIHGPFYLWTKKPVSKLEDLKGLRMRTGALYDRFMKQLGIVPVSIAPADVYVALERGMADGFGWPILGARKDGWTAKVKYLIGHPFYNQNGTILMNRENWDKMKPVQQQAIQEATAAFERVMVEYSQKEIEKEMKILKEQEGVKVIEFAPAEAEKYVNTAYEALAEALAPKIPADVMKKLREASDKK